MNILLICMHIFFVCYAFGLEVSQVICKDPNACGLRTGGPILQHVTRAEFLRPLGLFWKAAEDKLMFVDAIGPYVCEYKPDDEGKLRKGLISELDKQYLHSVTPILGEKRTYLLTTDSSLYKITFKEEGPSLTWNVRKVMDIYSNSKMWIYKAQASKSHKLWIASNEFSNSSITSAITAELLVVDVPKNKKLVDKRYEDLAGFGWGKNSSCMYTVSAKENCIYHYKFDPATDTATNRKVLFHLDDFSNIVKGNLSCAIIDDEDNLWMGISVTGMVARYNIKNKQIDIIISIPASFITSMAFGGKHYQHLYVATTSQNMKHTLREPGAGAIYAVSGTGSCGVHPNYVKIDE